MSTLERMLASGLAGGAAAAGVFRVEVGVDGTLGEDRETGLTPTAAKEK